MRKIHHRNVSEPLFVHYRGHKHHKHNVTTTTPPPAPTTVPSNHDLVPQFRELEFVDEYGVAESSGTTTESYDHSKHVHKLKISKREAPQHEYDGHSIRITGLLIGNLWDEISNAICQSEKNEGSSCAGDSSGVLLEQFYYAAKEDLCLPLLYKGCGMIVV